MPHLHPHTCPPTHTHPHIPTHIPTHTCTPIHVHAHLHMHTHPAPPLPPTCLTLWSWCALSKAWVDFSSPLTLSSSRAEVRRPCCSFSSSSHFSVSLTMASWNTFTPLSLSCSTTIRDCSYKGEGRGFKGTTPPKPHPMHLPCTAPLSQPVLHGQLT